jgi:putative tryptophan/tyrosine transport system substrate-binding protein
MKRREFIAGVGMTAAWPMIAQAQRQQAMPVVGFIDMRAPNSYEPFVRGLGEIGFADHRNVIIDHREAANVDQLPVHAVNLARDKVAVIVAATNAVIAAKEVSPTTPMVFIGATDPIAAGLVTSFNHPGGNVTGVRLVAGDLTTKQVELIHQIIPKATKIGLLISSRFPNTVSEVTAASDAARLLGLTLIEENVNSENEFEPAFLRFQQAEVNAILVITNVFFASVRERIVELASKYGTPMFGQSRSYPVVGALASYGTNYPDVMRQAGIYAGRILKGEKAADLPVLQPTTFELVLNLKTARELGLQVPTSLIARADEVIE